MSRSYSRADLACKVYVGNLGESAGRRELENAFVKFGPLKNVWVARNPPGFAFVEYEDSRDAEDAVKGLDGHMLCGHRAVVEMSTGEKRTSRRGGRSGPRSASYDDKCYTCGERGHFARDCRNSGRYGGYGGGRYSNSDRRRSRRSRSRSRDRSYSPRRYSDHSRSRSRSRGRSHSRSRSRSYSQRRRHSRSSSDRD